MQKFINKIFHDDCLTVMKNIPNESIDLIVTDPPYLINYKTGRRKNNDHDFCTVIQNDNNPQLIIDYIKECYRILKNNTAMYMFCNDIHVDFFKQELEKYFTIRNMIVWVKNNHTAGDLKYAFGKQYELIFLVNKGIIEFNGKRLTDIWFFDKLTEKPSLNHVNQQLHQNQKPQDLIEQCIEQHSKIDDIIFDGFMGSGTTLVSAKKLNRKYIGIEIEKKYFDIANNRIDNTQVSQNKQTKQGILL